MRTWRREGALAQVRVHSAAMFRATLDGVLVMSSENVGLRKKYVGCWNLTSDGSLLTAEKSQCCRTMV